MSVQPLRPRLVATPVSLYAAMPVGGQTVVDFDLSNQGGRASGPITVSLPAVPWMHLASTNPMPSLAPGQTNRVTLQLTPARDLPLGPYTGSLALNAPDSGTSVPFNFRAMSLCVGDLLVDAVDEFTYYAEGAPHLAGARVTVRDSVTQSNVVTGLTGTNGQFLVTRLNEGYYDLEVTADKHTTYRATHLLKAGLTNEVQAFLSRQTVTYTWTVEPVTIEDRYKVTIETTFETVVPMPVITIEPAVIDLAEITADETHLDIKITNHGLIAAGNTRLGFDASTVAVLAVDRPDRSAARAQFDHSAHDHSTVGRKRSGAAKCGPGLRPTSALLHVRHRLLGLGVRHDQYLLRQHRHPECAGGMRRNTAIAGWVCELWRWGWRRNVQSTDLDSDANVL